MIVIQVVMNDGRGYDGSDNCGGHGRVYGATVNVVVMTERAHGGGDGLWWQWQALW